MGGAGWLAAMFVSACASAAAPVAAVDAGSSRSAEPTALRDGEMKAQEFAGALAAASCPAEETFALAAARDLTVKPVRLMRLGAGERVGGLSFVAGFELDSPDERFGGVSGLDLTSAGNLIGVTDQGDWVFIGLSEDDGVTPESLRMGAMKGASGPPFDSKGDADAEGLDVADGLALVSFERDHRVLAFDLESCGVNARGVPAGDHGSGDAIRSAYTAAGVAFESNGGPEALARLPGGSVFVGVEAKAAAGAAASMAPLDGAPDFSARLAADAPELVGADGLASGDGRVRLFTVHRSFSPSTGPAIAVREAALQADDGGWRIGAERELARMGLLHTVDNFEGVAVQEKEDGGVRLFLISDDNFSASQRTLLMVFDVAE